jgi:UDP-N-acetylglucosamine--N-acetylmuramyl-(pentapeptide) pyrophosphoryl-undecaprenol N-acetylglucosamine transferase
MGRGYRLALVTDRRGSAYSGLLGDLETHRIRAAGISGRGLTARVSAVFQLGLGWLQARRLLKKLRPRAVVGFGGYPSVPTVVAASQLRCSTVIHEQNAVLGRANRVLAPYAARIATGFFETAMLREREQARAVHTGNPVRPEVIAGMPPYHAPRDGEPVEILVTGGSQGASIFGKIVPPALAALPAQLRRDLHVTQQCREEGLAHVKEIYGESGIEAELAPFFHDIPARLARAHLVIGRSGASTIAELAATGRPAIVIPYPHAIDDHQRENAAQLCDAGGGWLVPQSDVTAASLSELIRSLLESPEKLQRAAECALRVGVTDAAERLADLVCELIGDNTGSAGANDIETPKEAMA